MSDEEKAEVAALKAEVTNLKAAVERLTGNSKNTKHLFDFKLSETFDSAKSACFTDLMLTVPLVLQGRDGCLEHLHDMAAPANTDAAQWNTDDSTR